MSTRLSQLSSQFTAVTRPSDDLQRERSKASFPISKLSDHFYGGPSGVTARFQITSDFERDPSFRMHDVHDLTRAQIRERIMTRLPSVIKWSKQDAPEIFRMRNDLLAAIDPGFQTRIGVHFGLFCKTIELQGTPPQVKYWTDKGMLTFGVIGCFAMTELGHGSNVSALETTAIFDSTTDEFIINSPTPTSMKWWIGGAAESATHSVVFANLIIGDRSYGVKPFVTPLRDPATFKCYPGVSIGDIGAKMGRNGIDNGWIQFTNYRIPRSYMLMRFTKVDRQGKVTEPPFPQLVYGALVFARTSIIRESVETSRKALTIALRYSCVRRQFGPDDGLEQPIIELQTHKQRLIPLLAMCYAMHFAGQKVTSSYYALMEQIKTDLQGGLRGLKDFHGITAGLKAHCTWRASEIIDQCRQACGGQGYSSYNGLASLFVDFVVQCTWEGDNTVLMLQTGNYLVNSFLKSQVESSSFRLKTNSRS